MPPPHVAPATPPPVCLLFCPTGHHVAFCGTSTSHSPSHPPLCLCCVSLLSFPASCCIVSCQPATLRLLSCIASPAHSWLLRLLPAPLSLIAVAWPLLTLHCCLPFRLSWASCPAGNCITSLSFGWFLHRLSSCRHLPSAGTSASHCTVPCCHAPLHAIASHASSQAGCCIASTHAATYHLPALPPLISPLPLVAPWPPVPLVQLVVALPFLTPLPTICRCLRLSLRPSS
jgi:hypothetical protein